MDEPDNVPPFVALPPLTPEEAALIRDLIAHRLGIGLTSIHSQGPMLWSLHTAFAEAVANHPTGRTL